MKLLKSRPPFLNRHILAVSLVWTTAAFADGAQGGVGHVPEGCCRWAGAVNVIAANPITGAPRHGTQFVPEGNEEQIASGARIDRNIDVRSAATADAATLDPTAAASLSICCEGGAEPNQDLPPEVALVSKSARDGQAKFLRFFNGAVLSFGKASEDTGKWTGEPVASSDQRAIIGGGRFELTKEPRGLRLFSWKW